MLGRKSRPGADQQKAYIILNGYLLCLSCPTRMGFVPREWQAEKGLFPYESNFQPFRVIIY